MKRTKLFLSLFLVLIFCVSFAFSVSADNSIAPNTMTGYLVSSDGCTVPIIGTRVDSSSFQNLLRNGEKSSTYEYNVLSSQLGNRSAEGTDGALAAKAYLTISWKENSAIPTEYLLTEVSRYWEILDSSVYYTSADLTFGCNGPYPFPPVTNQVKTYTDISNYFSYDTGFTRFIAGENSAAVMGANLTVHLASGNGSRSWDLFLINNLNIS